MSAKSTRSAGPGALGIGESMIVLALSGPPRRL